MAANACPASGGDLSIDLPQPHEGRPRLRIFLARGINREQRAACFLDLVDEGGFIDAPDDFDRSQRVSISFAKANASAGVRFCVDFASGWPEGNVGHAAGG